jgi:flavin-dependent dehydrogenase
VGIPTRVKGRYALNSRAYYEGVGGVKNRCELYYLRGICPGYFWIFPVDEKTCNVGVGMRPEDFEKQNKTLEQIVHEVLQREPFKSRFAKAKRVTEFKRWGLSVLGKRRKASGNGFVLCGDAGTFAMTFSGEGVGPSMRTGKIAAQGIVRALKENDVSARNLKRNYDDVLWKILGPEVKGFRWLEFLLLNEPLFDWVVERAGKNRDLVEISSRMQNDYSLSQKMVHPRTLLKLLFT